MPVAAYTALLKFCTVVGIVATSYAAPKHAPHRMDKLRTTPSGSHPEGVGAAGELAGAAGFDAAAAFAGAVGVFFVDAG
jgi:hypothetical protein